MKARKRVSLDCLGSRRGRGEHRIENGEHDTTLHINFFFHVLVFILLPTAYKMSITIPPLSPKFPLPPRPVGIRWPLSSQVPSSVFQTPSQSSPTAPPPAQTFSSERPYKSPPTPLSAPVRLIPLQGPSMVHMPHSSPRMITSQARWFSPIATTCPGPYTHSSSSQHLLFLRMPAPSSRKSVSR